MKMSLERALHILARVHTKDDEQAGFAVEMGAKPDCGNMVSREDYVTAWGVVREHLGQPAFLEHEIPVGRYSAYQPKEG